MAESDRIIGRLEKAVERMEIALSGCEARLTKVESERDEERGGRKMLMTLGAVVATAWGVIGSFIGGWLKGL